MKVYRRIVLTAAIGLASLLGVVSPPACYGCGLLPGLSTGSNPSLWQMLTPILLVFSIGGLFFYLIRGE